MAFAFPHITLVFGEFILIMCSSMRIVLYRISNYRSTKFHKKVCFKKRNVKMFVRAFLQWRYSWV